MAVVDMNVTDSYRRNMTLNDRVRQVIEERGMTVTDVADRLSKADARMFWRIVSKDDPTKNPGVFSLLRVAKAIGTSIDELLRDVEPYDLEKGGAVEAA